MKLVYFAAVALAHSSLMFRREVSFDDLRAALKAHGKTPSKGQLKSALKKMRRAGIVDDMPGVQLNLRFRSDFSAVTSPGTVDLYMRHGRIPEHLYLRAPLHRAA